MHYNASCKIRKIDGGDAMHILGSEEAGIHVPFPLLSLIFFLHVVLILI